MNDTLNITAQPQPKGKPNVIARLGKQTLHRDRIDPGVEADRTRFAKATCKAAPALSMEAVTQELVSVADRLDESTERNGQAKPQVGPEVDVSSIERPDILIGANVSAIAVPYVSKTADGFQTEWKHYYRAEADPFSGGEVERRAEPMNPEGFKTSGGFYRTMLHPMPGEPSPGEVRRLGRWTRESRERWLEAGHAPDTGGMLRAVRARVERYIVLPPDNPDGHALTLAAWAMMTYLYRALPAVPYLHLTGPADSGKSRTMDVLSRLSWRPISTASATGPTLFRTRHAHGGTLFLDEAENMKEDSPAVADLRQILLAGYRNGGTACRMEAIGDTFRTVEFDIYGPSAMGAIRGFPTALASRCIPIRMMRAPEGDERAARGLDDTPQDEIAVRDMLHCWALEHGHAAVTAQVETGLSNRSAELWGPLLRIVAHGGDAEALQVLRDHAQAIAAEVKEDSAPEADPVFLAALLSLLDGGRSPKVNEVLTRAKVLHPELWDGWTPKAVGSVLRRYSFRATKANGNYVYRYDPSAVRRVAERYGFDLDCEFE